MPPRFDYFPIDENHPNYSEEPYGLSKWICEQQADSFARRHEDIRIANGGKRSRAHGALQGVLGIQESWCVEDNHLDVALGADADHSIARGLGLGADDGQLLPDDPVEERGFSRVGFSDDGDEARPRHTGE